MNFIYLERSSSGVGSDGVFCRRISGKSAQSIASMTDSIQRMLSGNGMMALILPLVEGVSTTLLGSLHNIFQNEYIALY